MLHFCGVAYNAECLSVLNGIEVFLRFSFSFVKSLKGEKNLDLKKYVLHHSPGYTHDLEQKVTHIPTSIRQSGISSTRIPSFYTQVVSFEFDFIAIFTRGRVNRELVARFCQRGLDLTRALAPSFFLTYLTYFSFVYK